MAVQTNGTDHPLRVIVFDNLRNRSHIFTRLFCQHHELTQIWHPYVMTSFLGPDRITTRVRQTEDRMHEVTVEQAPMFVTETYGKSSTNLEEAVAKIEKTGKSCWINEHCAISIRQDVVFTHLSGHQYTTEDLGKNPTYFPDWLFETCTPVIVIRHPVFQVPSLYNVLCTVTRARPGTEDFEYLSTLYYCRLIFDLFKSRGRNPVVVDGDDVVWRTQEMTTNVCNAIGIDPSGVKEAWEITPAEDRHPNVIVQAYLGTMYDSTGVERPAEKPEEPLDIDARVKQMEEKYGAKTAALLKGHIERNVADYEYLRQFKV